MKQLILTESLRGVVSEVLGNQVEITYETRSGPMKQIYNREQFLGGKMPHEGDSVQADLAIWLVDREPTRATSDIPSFEGRSIKGELRI